MPQSAVIYCRASKDRTGSAVSVVGQEMDCRAFAETKGLHVREVYTDNDITASGKKVRPGYRRLLTDLPMYPGTTVIVWHTDRLHRHPVELEEYIALAETYGILTLAVRVGELDLTTPSGKMVARMLGAAAKHELEIMSQRRKDAKARQAQEGAWRGGRRPFGYQRDGTSVEAAEAEAIREAATGVVDGLSLREVTRRLNAAGHKTTGGRDWDPSEVSRMLRRPRNAGFIEHNKQVVGPAKWDPVLPEEQWRAICAILSDPSRRTSPGPQPRWLLSGIAKCGICEEGLVVQRVAGKGRTPRPVYRCRSGRKSDDRAAHVARDATMLDEFVRKLVIARLSRPDVTFETRSEDTAELHEQTIAIQAQLDELAVLAGKREITARQLAIASGPLRAELEALEERLSVASRLAPLAPFAEGRDVPKTWDMLPLERQRATISELLTLRVLPARKGRVRGWRPGEPYFDPSSVSIGWRS